VSGGSLDYAYGKLNDAISMMAARAKTPLHKAFLKHLVLVSEALHDVEWVYSGDYSEDQAEESIKKVLGAGAKAAELEVIRDELKALIEIAQRLVGPGKESGS
jgi:hypothetical protein